MVSGLARNILVVSWLVVWLETYWWYMVSGLARNILVVSWLVVWLETYWWYHG